MDDEAKSYEMGVRDGKITSLENAVSELTIDVRKMKVMMWMLYGAIGLVQFLPELREFIDHAAT